MELYYKENVKKYEELYKEGHNHSYPNLNLVRIQRSFLYKNLGKTLDFGFGVGENMLFLAKEGNKMFGLETSKTAIKITEKKFKIAKKKAVFKLLKNSKKLNFKNNFFDNIVALSVFSQLKTKKRLVSLLNEFNRIMKPNSKFIFDINGPSKEYLNNPNALVLRKNEFIKIIKEAGFKIINTGEVKLKYLGVDDLEYLVIGEKL